MNSRGPTRNYLFMSPPAPKLGASKHMGAIFLEKKAPAATYPQARGLQKYGAHFSEKKKRLRQRTHKLGASKNMGAVFLEKKKAPAATYPQVRGFQDLGTKKNGEPERRSLSVCRGAAAGPPPPGGLGGWKPPRNCRPPVKTILW